MVLHRPVEPAPFHRTYPPKVTGIAFSVFRHSWQTAMFDLWHDVQSGTDVNSIGESAVEDGGESAKETLDEYHLPPNASQGDANLTPNGGGHMVLKKDGLK